MTLDQFGKIAAAEIAFYVPVFCVAFFIALKHGFARREGWVFLFTFALFRIVGAALTLAVKVSSKPQIGLEIAAAVLSGTGLTPLLLATMGFVGKIAVEGLPSSARALRAARILLTIALILGAVGGSIASPGNSPSTINTGRTLTRVSAVMFMVVFTMLFTLHVLLWFSRSTPTRHRNVSLLSGVSLALPPLFVRLVYTLFSAFAAFSQSRFSQIDGDWRIYLGMDLIMEYLVVVVYVSTGALIYLHKEDIQAGSSEVELERHKDGWEK
ncbi:hypothetical protein K439DRAFT_1408240 [Ramaria rubella]|nr:hypothetical protein K439DRAFT_1408240 [Ramaria rubella]